MSGRTWVGSARTVRSETADLRALAKLAGAGADGAAGPTLEDHRALRDAAALDAMLATTMDATSGDGRLVLDFADGARFALRRGQRLRFWRRPLVALS